MQLTTRERRWGIAVGALLVLTAGYHLAVRPALARMKTLERVLPRKRQALALLQRRADEYTALRARLAGMRRRAADQPAGFGILSFLEQAGKRAGIPRGNVLDMAPTTRALEGDWSETTVQVRLQGVSLPQVAAFLAEVRKAPILLGVRSLHVRQSRRARGKLDAAVEAAVLRRSARGAGGRKGS